MSRRILVPLDGSPFSERALTVAVPLAQQQGASLVLAMASPLPPAPADTGMAGALDPSHHLSVREHLRHSLERTARRVATKYGVTTATQFRDGAIIDELEGAIADTQAAFVVMTTHGRGGLSRAWLGSVTDALVRRASVPLLITRTVRKWTLTAAGEPFFPRLLVAVDGSPLSEAAFEVTLAQLGESVGEFVLVRVDDAPIAAVSSTWISEATRRLQESYLEPLAARFRTPGRRITTLALVHHDAPRAILDAVRSTHAFGLALATHGRTGVRRAVLGSVADKVIRAAGVPVFVVPSAGTD